MNRAIKLVVGTLGGLVVAAGVLVITASAVGIHLAGAAQGTAPPAAGPASTASPATDATGAPRANPAAPPLARAVAQAEAQALGLQPTDLAKELGHGATIHQLADQAGITQADFQASFAGDLKAILDQDVRRGSLTARQEQAYLRRLGDGVPNWDRAVVGR